jgi:hypothetical protein
MKKKKTRRKRIRTLVEKRKRLLFLFLGREEPHLLRT